MSNDETIYAHKFTGETLTGRELDPSGSGHVPTHWERMTAYSDGLKGSDLIQTVEHGWTTDEGYSWTSTDSYHVSPANRTRIINREIPRGAQWVDGWLIFATSVDVPDAVTRIKWEA